MSKIRLIELFAGYGSQALALKRINIPFESYRVVEFDKYAVASYNALHDTDFKPLDIRQVHAKDLGIVDTDEYTYLMTYSFPCTDLSIAGKREGMSKDSGTRSGLLWEVERILEECEDLPQVLLMENVPQVHGEKNLKDFSSWINFLTSKGYRSKWKDLNAKDYGIPQNRERCFMVSYLDKDKRFEFPEPLRLDKTLSDYLEDTVDEKYYLSSDKVPPLIDATGFPDKEKVSVYMNYRRIDKVNVPVAKTLCARDFKGFGSGFDTSNGLIEKITDYKIRRYTPLEYLRLMGVTDEEAKRMLTVNSDTQIYKQAGNSIVVNVMAEIFKNLFLGGSDNIPSQMEIEDLL